MPFQDLKNQLDQFEEPEVTPRHGADQAIDTSVDDGIDVGGEVSDQQVDQVQDEPQAQEQPQEQPAGQPIEDNPQYVNAHARARYLEKNNKILESRLLTAVNALNLIAANQQAAIAQQQVIEQQKQEELEDLDPLSKLMKQIEDLKTEIKNGKAEREIVSQISTERDALVYADTQIRRAVESSQDYKGAINHLADIVRQNMEDDHPDKTEEEQQAIATVQMKNLKLKWIKEGKNPAEEFYKRAVRLGYKPTPQQTQAQTQQPKAQADPRQQIQRERQKQEAGSSISGIQSAPSRKLNPKTLAAARNQETFDDIVDRAVAAGTMTRPSGSTRKTPPFSQLLAGLGKTVSDRRI